MSPQKKLPKSKPEGKRKLDCPECPYCNFHVCWKHGKYERNGFHSFLTEPRNIPVEVPRYLCQCPTCHHTFSVLPEAVLPYCRFLLNGLFSIIQDNSEGKTAYRIAKERWDTTERAILRAIDRIEKVTPWLRQQFQEQTGRVKSSFRELVHFLEKRFSWFRLTRNWYHHFYPLRVGHILNPHNLSSIGPGG